MDWGKRKAVDESTACLKTNEVNKVENDGADNPGENISTGEKKAFERKDLCSPFCRAQT